MSVSELSSSTQTYLRAIWSLGEWSDDPVTATSLAARTGVKLSTASDAIRKLATQGLVEHSPYGAVTLTEEGRTHAVTMVRRHRLIETFLAEVLGYTWDQVHDEADALEHAVSDFLVARLSEHLGHPDRDPHGDPIPRADGTVSKPDAMRLTTLEPGRRVRVERVADDDPELLEFLAEHGIRPGATLESQPAPPYSETTVITVADGDQGLSLGRQASDAVWVQLV